MKTRKLLEQEVCAYNTCLKDVADKMDLITLLRNDHPTYRENFAISLMNEKAISREQCKEFTKLIRP